MNRPDEPFDESSAPIDPAGPKNTDIDEANEAAALDTFKADLKALGYSSAVALSIGSPEDERQYRAGLAALQAYLDRLGVIEADGV